MIDLLGIITKQAPQNGDIGPDQISQRQLLMATKIYFQFRFHPIKTFAFLLFWCNLELGQLI